MSAARRRQLAGVLILSARLVWAHESPEHEIEVLTAKMAAAGKTAELLGRRATEWRALGRLKEARADLREAISIRPGSVSLLCELAQVEGVGRRYDSAIKAVDGALALTVDEENRAGIYMLRAEILESKGDYKTALADCTRAFAAGPPAIDWYLTRGRLQARAGKWRECAAGLQQGFEETGSIVLEMEWIDAMLDAGEFEGALKRIERYADRGRFKSAWLVRRARAQIGTGARAAAHANLEKARQELTARLSNARPEISLLIERGLAHALLGDMPAAQADWKRVQELGGDRRVFGSAVYRLERALRP
jgi:tetratricopeptide (TPR) repeat protein